MFLSFIRSFIPEDDTHDAEAHLSLRFVNRILFLVFIGYVGFILFASVVYLIAGCSYSGSLGAGTVCTVASLKPLVDMTNWSPLFHMAIIFIGMPLWALAALGTGLAGFLDTRRVCRRERIAFIPCFIREMAFWNLVLATLYVAGIIVVLSIG